MKILDQGLTYNNDIKVPLLNKSKKTTTPAYKRK